MNKIRIGIIGAGDRGVRNFGALFTKTHGGAVELKALADPNRERAEAGLAFLDVKADIHTDVHDMLARKDLDAVVVTTPDYLHEECCVAALKAGKHVLVDKPLAITGRGCLRVIEASRKAGKVLYMGFNMRHDPVLKQVKKMAEAGTFGEVFSLQAIEHYNGGRTYMARWNRLKRYSGGLWPQHLRLPRFSSMSALACSRHSRTPGSIASGKPTSEDLNISCIMTRTKSFGVCSDSPTGSRGQQVP